MSMAAAFSMNNRKRQLGVIGVDHNEYGHRTKRVLLSVGRHSPVAPQSIIAQQVTMSLPPQSSLPDPRDCDLMAPRGDKFEAMIPKRGEWAVKVDVCNGESHVSAPYGVARINDTQVTTCGNGTDVNAKIVFLGIVTNAQDGMDNNRDDVGALDISGTVTGINYGPERLCAGDHAYIGLPHMIESNNNGKVTMVPSVCAAGMPASKAHYGTYRMRWNNVSTAVAEITDFITELYSKDKSQKFTSSGNLHTKLTVERGVRAEMPIYEYATIFAHQTRCVDVVKQAPGPEQRIALNSFLLCMQDIDKNNMKLVENYDKSLGLDKPVANPIQIESALEPTSVTEGELKRLIDLLVYADRLKYVAIDLMHNFMRQRMMGKVLVNSDPGQQLDIAMGYFA